MRKVHLFKKYLSQLLGTVKVKRPSAGCGNHLVPPFADFRRIPLSQIMQKIRVHRKPCALHPEQYKTQGLLDFPHQSHHAIFFHPGFLPCGKRTQCSGVLRLFRAQRTEAVTLFLRIKQICREHRVPAETVRNRQPAAVKHMQQCFPVMHYGIPFIQLLRDPGQHFLRIRPRTKQIAAKSDLRLFSARSGKGY